MKLLYRRGPTDISHFLLNRDSNDSVALRNMKKDRSHNVYSSLINKEVLLKPNFLPNSNTHVQP